MANNTENSGRIIGGAWDSDAQRHYYTNLSYYPGELNRLIYGRKRVVPVLFIPGIMGSKLRIKNFKKMAWDPPSNTVEDVSSLMQYICMSAEARAKVLNPDSTEVVRNEAGSSAHADKKTGEVAETLRGWESVWDRGYDSIMKEIDTKLAAIDSYFIKIC
jgi:hypothetical protein